MNRGRLGAVNPITTATTVDEQRRAATVAVLPVGSFEQHGAHLPLATDTLIASVIAKATAEHYDLLLLPPVTISCSHEHVGWSGTVSISARTLMLLIDDIAASLHRSGIDHLVLVNGHGGNYVLANIVQEANVDGPRMALFPGREDWDRARTDADLRSSAHDDMHAGELETSILLHTMPDVVRPGYQDADHVSDRPHLLITGMRGYTTTGVLGRPSLATEAKGKAILDSLVTSFSATLNVLRQSVPLPVAGHDTSVNSAVAGARGQHPAT